MVLVENDAENAAESDEIEPPEDREFNEDDRLHDFDVSQNETFFKGLNSFLKFSVL